MALVRCADSVCTRAAITRPRVRRRGSLGAGFNRGREVAREALHQRIGVALHAGAGERVEAPRRAQRIRIDTRDLVLHLLAEAREIVVAEDVEARHHVDELADVRDHGVAEHERLAVLVLLQALGDALDRLAEPAVEVAHRTVQALLDLLLDVAPDPVDVVGRELGHELLGVLDRRDAVADRELAPQRLLRGIVLDAEELAEVEAGLVDVLVVVLDEAGALAHDALAEPVHELGVVVVVGDGEEAQALVVPGKRVFVVGGTDGAHGRGERGERGLGQQALVVAPGAGRGVVVDGDVVGSLAVVEAAGPGGDAQGHLHGVVGEVHGSSPSRLCYRSVHTGTPSARASFSLAASRLDARTLYSREPRRPAG